MVTVDNQNVYLEYMYEHGLKANAQIKLLKYSRLEAH